MYTLIRHQRLESASTVTFSGIPQIYTDLLVVASLRDSSGEEAETRIAFNGVTTGFSSRHLTGNGSSVSSGTTARLVGFNRDDVTANTFNNVQIYISNYSGSTNKSFSVESVTENNATSANQHIIAGLWSNTAAITSLTLSSSANNFRTGSTATLYGINRTQAIGKPSQPKAIGGNITFANGYWVHTFTGSGTLVPTQNLTAEYLVIAGGGGTTFALGGGGGAGGYRCSVQGEMSGGGTTAESPAMLTANTSYAVVVGAGGAAEQLSNQGYGGQGSDSSFAGVTSLGGGRGVGQSINFPNNPPGQSGGSGSGGVRNNNTPGAGTAGQGYSGGSGSNNANGYGGGGGGGAGGVGSNGGTSNGGNGGAGVTSSITGTAIARAGGGGGAVGTGTVATAVAGGGQGGSDTTAVATNGSPNTGGGAGGGNGSGRAGGSGVVIIRYKAD